MSRFQLLFKLATVVSMITGPVSIIALLIYCKAPLKEIPHGLTRAFRDGWIETDIAAWTMFQGIALLLVVVGLYLAVGLGKDAGRAMIVAGFSFGLSPLAFILIGMEYLIDGRLFKISLLGSSMATVVFFSLVLGSVTHKGIQNWAKRKNLLRQIH